MLLPSQELRELSERVDVCLSGKETPPGCDIRYRQFYWLMVYDERGELLSACRLSDELTKKKQQGLSLPEALVAVVEERLKVSPSLEQLERQYVEERGSQAAYDALVEKVKQIEGVGQMRVADFFVEAAAKTAVPVVSQMRGVLMRADACDHQVINHAAYAELRASIEAFLQQHPGSAHCAELLEPLLEVGMKYTFDVSGRCEAYAQQWSDEAAGPPETLEARQALAEELRAMCKEDLKRASERLARMKPGAYGQLRLQARLGQAQQTLDGLDATKSFGVMRPIHAEWRRDAQASLGAAEASDK
ncbi:MAG: hypothetical protein VYE77_08515 [Planctomycetota bacterium]|nr:hypothetical protein [Planctomycetota bacterium]